MERYNPIGTLPIDPGGYHGDALGSVLDDGDLGWARPNQTRRRLPYAIISCQPLVIMKAAEAERIVGKLLHGVGGRLA